MNPQQPVFDPDDTEGHGSRHPLADADRDQTDDTQGHGARFPGVEAERDEDDVAGHLSGALGSKKKTEHDG